jgi:transcriptional regulator with XRE-family HTH domain
MTKFKDWMDKASGRQIKRLAKLSGVTFAHIYAIASGLRNPSTELAARIEAATQRMVAESDYTLPVVRREDLSKTCKACPYFIKCNSKN